MNQRRAFASKLLRDSNVDVRHRLAKILSSASSSSVLANDESSFVLSPKATSLEQPDSLASPSSSNGCSSAPTSTFFCDTPINDLVDSVDYEDFIVHNQSRIPTALRDTLLFPADDIQVDKYQPPVRTLESTSPEFNNVATLEDPYIQSIGSYAPKSQLVTKKYEECSSLAGVSAVRQSYAKELRRQEYEIDIIVPNSKSIDDEDDCYLESDTPLTFYSRQTSTANTPRPQSLVSSSSTIRPPLASDEEDCDADDRHQRTPVGERAGACDNQSENGSVRSLFSLQHSHSDPQISAVLEKDFYSGFFENLRKHYSSEVRFHNDDEEAKRSAPNLPLFQLFPMVSEIELIEHRPSVPPPADVPRFCLQFKCLQLQMDITIEPIFANVAIYDAKEKKKVTENFYFDMNTGKSIYYFWFVLI